MGYAKKGSISVPRSIKKKGGKKKKRKRKIARISK